MDNKYSISRLYVPDVITFRNNIVSRLSAEHVALFDMYYTKIDYWDFYEFPKACICAIDHVTTRMGLFPELPLKCLDRRKMIYNLYGLPDADIVSLVGSLVYALNYYIESYEVSVHAGSKKECEIVISNGFIKSNPMLPKLEVKAYPNCKIQIISKDYKSLSNWFVTRSPHVIEEEELIFKYIKRRMKLLMLDIVEFILKDSGYLK